MVANLYMFTWRILATCWLLTIAAGNLGFAEFGVRELAPVAAILILVFGAAKSST